MSWLQAYCSWLRLAPHQTAVLDVYRIKRLFMHVLARRCSVKLSAHGGPRAARPWKQQTPNQSVDSVERLTYQPADKELDHRGEVEDRNPSCSLNCRGKGR